MSSEVERVIQIDDSRRSQNQPKLDLYAEVENVLKSSATKNPSLAWNTEGIRARKAAVLPSLVCGGCDTDTKCRSRICHVT